MSNTISNTESRRIGLKTVSSMEDFNIKSVNLNDKVELKETGTDVDLDDLDDMIYGEDFPDDFLADFFEEQEHEQFLESQWTQFRRNAGGGYRLVRKRLRDN